jgi:hypothetical protein
MTPDLSPHCGQALPGTPSHVTPRELDVLTHWWMTDSVQHAARLAGVGEQRAKNMLRAARIRNQASTNSELLAMHFARVRSHATEIMQQNIRATEAA